MKRFNPSFWLVTAMAVGLTGLPTAPVGAAGATESAGVALNPHPVAIDGSIVKTNVRPPIAFRPLPMVDPKTGQPCSPDTMITLPNGQQVTAREFYDQANRLEQQFNAMGYSLRHRESVKILETRTDRAVLQAQAARITGEHRPFDPATMSPQRSLAEAAGAFRERAPQEAARMQQLRLATAGRLHTQASPYTYSKSWEWSGGNSMIRGSLRGRFELYGRSDVTQIWAWSRAGGGLVGFNFDLADVVGMARSWREGPQIAQLKLWVVGLGTVYNLDEQRQVSWSVNDTLSKNIHLSQSFYFSIGPIPMVGRVGVRGWAGVGYYVGLRGASAEAKIWPQAGCEAYASVAATIGVAEAGVRGRLVMLRDIVKLDGLLYAASNGGRPYLHIDCTGYNDMTMLSGSLQAYVSALFGLFEGSWDIFSWDGINVRGYFFVERRDLGI